MTQLPYCIQCFFISFLVLKSFSLLFSSYHLFIYWRNLTENLLQTLTSFPTQNLKLWHSEPFASFSFCQSPDLFGGSPLLHSTQIYSKGSQSTTGSDLPWLSFWFWERACNLVLANRTCIHLSIHSFHKYLLSILVQGKWQWTKQKCRYLHGPRF